MHVVALSNFATRLPLRDPTFALPKSVSDMAARGLDEKNNV